MAYEGQNAAAGLLSNQGAFVLEVGGIGRDGGRVGAVQVRDSKDVRSTALCGAVTVEAIGLDLRMYGGKYASSDLRSAAGNICLTLLNSLDGGGDGDAQEESGDGGDVLHFECWY